MRTYHAHAAAPHPVPSLHLCSQHNQDRLVEQSGGPDKSYFIPDPTDKIVKQMMVWMKKVGPYVALCAPVLSKRVLFLIS